MDHIKEDQGLMELVSSESGLPIKKEIGEEDWKDTNEQQCVQVPTTRSVVASLNVSTDIANPGDGLHIKTETSDIDIYPTIIQRVDTHRENDQLNMSFAGREKTSNNDINNHSFKDRVKDEIVEDNLGDSHHIIEETQPKQQLEFRLYVCATCSKTFKTERSCSIHCTRVHGVQSRKCIPCNKKYKSKDHLLAHILKAHCRQQFKCVACNERFQSMISLRNHFLKIHRSASTVADQPRVFKCSECPKVLQNYGSYIKHITNVHSTEPHKCARCSKQFKCKYYLFNHVRYAHSNQQHECNICTKAYTSKQSLCTHSSKFHGSVSPTYICDYCDKVFYTRTSLVVHIKKIHRLSHRCIECNLSFVNKLHLQTHVNEAHRDYDCNSILGDKDGHSRHLNATHVMDSAGTQQRIYTCDYCQKVFNVRSAIQVHISSMHVDITYKCSQCNERFKCKQTLTAHTARCNAALTELICGKAVMPSRLSMQSAALDKRQGEQDPETFSIAGQCDGLTIKQEPQDVDLEIGPTLLQHLDSHYGPNQVKAEQIKRKSSPPEDGPTVKNEPDLSKKENIAGVSD